MNIRKIIAREGLVILAFLGSICTFIGMGLYAYMKPESWSYLWGISRNQIQTAQSQGELIMTWSFWAGIVLYFVYLIARFIIWAIRTLREKE